MVAVCMNIGCKYGGRPIRVKREHRRMAENLERFVDAQAPVWADVLAELREGRKRSHWMWFVFPQLAGLGRSAMAEHYALHSAAEAAAYLGHPVLGPRLRQATRLVLGYAGQTAEAILGPIDAMKFRSSMTLFARARPDEPVFQAALDAFWRGAADPATLELLER
jgi:uncharacterized protein (DUF1810 family)